MAHDRLSRASDEVTAQREHIQRQGRFVLVERVGESAMVQLWRAWDQHHQVDRMLRVLKPELCLNPAARERFVQDGQALLRVEHKHLLQIHDVQGRGSAPYVVMDFAGGGSLHARIARQGPMAPRRALQVAQQLAQAVAVVHGVGLVHRDVTPRNVLLTDRGLARLGAPGLWLDEQEEAVTVPHAAMATLGQLRAGLASSGSDDIGYVAPEQIEHPAEVDARADVYALGATLWTLVTGQHARVLFGAAESGTLTRLPDATRVVILGCCGYQREDRFQSMRELLDALALALAPPGTVGPRPSASSPGPREDFDETAETDVRADPRSLPPGGGPIGVPPLPPRKIDRPSVPPPAPPPAHAPPSVLEGDEPPPISDRGLPPRPVPSRRPPPRRVSEPHTPTLSDGWIERPVARGDDLPPPRWSPLPYLLLAIALVLGVGAAAAGVSTVFMRLSEQSVVTSREQLYLALGDDDGQIRQWLQEEVDDAEMLRRYEAWRRTPSEPARLERALAFVAALQAHESELGLRGARLGHSRRVIDDLQAARTNYERSLFAWRERARGLGRIAIRVGTVDPPPPPGALPQ